jgi:hypothetical protein
MVNFVEVEPTTQQGICSRESHPFGGTCRPALDQVLVVDKVIQQPCGAGWDVPPCMLRGTSKG